MAKPVLRFAVVDDGRCSLEWRIWTGSSSPTQELYIAPRANTYPFKVSVHSDGYCQLAFTAGARPALRDADRQALTRWWLPTSAEWTLAYQLVYPTDDLLPGTAGTSVTSWPAAPAGSATCVAVYRQEVLGAPDPTVGTPWIAVARLPRQHGEVFIGVSHRPVDPAAVRPQAGGHLWRLPDPVAHANPYAHLFTTDEQSLCPTVIEYAKRHHAGANRLQAPGFTGRVKLWSAAPTDLREEILERFGDRHFCAVLQHRPGGKTKAILHVDEFARCNLAALGAKAEALSRRTSQMDRRRERVSVILPAGPDHSMLTDEDRAIAAIPRIGAVSARVFDGTTLRTLGRV